MTLKNFFNIALVAATMTLTACKTQTTVQKGNNKTTTETTNTGKEKAEMLEKVTANAQNAQYVTSKIKLKLQMGDKDISLGGKLCMKRNDVIRIQLTALGLFEAGRMEFTKDYVLVMDRMNKQYIKVDYNQVDFLKQSGLNFNSLQALFWNELFIPGQNDNVTANDIDSYDIETPNNSTITLTLNKNNLHYKWTADRNNGNINNFNGSYTSKGDNVGVDWTYGTFKTLGTKQFPTANNIKVTTPKKNVNAEIQLNNVSNDSDWETRTSVPSKYKQVSFNDILRKMSSL